MSNEHKICRICLAQKSKGSLTSIFEANASLASQIFYISGVQLIEFLAGTVQFQALICATCIKELSIATKFRRKCLESNKHFSKILAEIEQSRWTEELKLIKEDGLDTSKVKVEPEDDNTYPLSEASQDIPDEPFLEQCVLLKEEITEEQDEPKQKKVKEIEDYCKLCSKKFYSKHAYQNHMRAIHEKLNEADMHKCPQCDQIFKMKRYLNRHIKKMHIEKNFEDEIPLNEKKNNFECSKCHRFFASRKNLIDHIRIRHEFVDYSERFICDYCGKPFILKYHMLKHMKATHLKIYRKKKIETLNLPCSICGKILKTKNSLSTHEKNHRVLKPEEYWYCDLCGNKFKGRGEMMFHIRHRHLYKTKYYCDKCPGKFYHKLFYLQKHIKVFHNNIREFKCEWCGKLFGDKNRMNTHARIHTGEQPYKCTWPGCDRKFTHNTDFRRHKWGHTGERPYKCDFPDCTRGFMKISELKAHKSRCHSIDLSSIS